MDITLIGEPDLFEKEILRKIDSKEIFTEEELREIEWGCDIVDKIKGEVGRWTQSVSSIFKIGNRFFRLDWERGNVEYQENFYPYQPYEVYPEERMVKKTFWKEIKK